MYVYTGSTLRGRERIVLTLSAKINLIDWLIDCLIKGELREGIVYGTMRIVCALLCVYMGATMG